MLHEWASIFLTLFVANASAQTADVPIHSADFHGYSSVQEAFRALQETEGIETKVERDWTIVVDGPHHDLWWFAARASPAYPGAVVMHSSVRLDGAVWTDLQVKCEANVRVCDEMVRQFQETNESSLGNHMQRSARPARPSPIEPSVP